MNLPDEMHFRETLHGHGAKGMYVYCYASTAGEGVHVEVRSDRRGAPETKSWSHVAMPGRVFPTLEALKVALEPVTEEQAAAERARWPTATVEPEHDGSTNKCRLCPPGPGRPLARHRVKVMLSWIETSHYAGLCDEHRPLAGDPAALVAALDAEVAARRARRAEKGLP